MPPERQGPGGARPGAGRKPLGDRKRRKTTMILAPEVLATLDEQAAAWECSRSEALDRIVRDWTRGEFMVITDEGHGEEELRDLERVEAASLGQTLTPDAIGEALDPS